MQRTVLTTLLFAALSGCGDDGDTENYDDLTDAELAEQSIAKAKECKLYTAAQ